MWIGKGEFDSHGYFKSAFIKGGYEHLDPGKCYRIFNKGRANSPDQFHFIPVDAQGNETGPSVFNTAGVIVYSIWANGQSSQAYNISNAFIS